MKSLWLYIVAAVISDASLRTTNAAIVVFVTTRMGNSICLFTATRVVFVMILWRRNHCIISFQTHVFFRSVLLVVTSTVRSAKIGISPRQ